RGLLELDVTLLGLVSLVLPLSVLVRGSESGSRVFRLFDRGLRPGGSRSLGLTHAASGSRGRRARRTTLARLCGARGGRVGSRTRTGSGSPSGACSGLRGSGLDRCLILTGLQVVDVLEALASLQLE